MLSTAHGSLAPAAGARASPPRRRLVDARGGFSPADSRRGPSRRFALRATNRVVSAANDPSPSSSPTTPPSFTRRLVERRYDTDAARALLLSLRARGVRSSEHLRAYLRDHAAPRFAGDAAQIAVVSLGAYASFLTRDALDLVLALDPAAGPFAPLARFGLGVLGFALACESIALASKAAPVAFSHAAWYADADEFLDALGAVAEDATRRERRKRGLEATAIAAELKDKLANNVVCAAARGSGAGGGEERRVKKAAAERASESASTTRDVVDRLGVLTTLARTRESRPDLVDAAGVHPALDAEAARRLASAFARFDDLGVGALDAERVRAMARWQGVAVDDDEKRDALARVLDGNGDGEVGFADFVEWYAGFIPIECGAERGCVPVFGRREDGAPIEQPSRKKEATSVSSA